MQAPDLKSIFVEALGREPGAERSAFLDGACRGDATLRARVEEMLRDHERLGGFLATTHGEPSGRGGLTVALGPASSGVLTELAESLGEVPRVLLHDLWPEAGPGLAEPVRPTSSELPVPGDRPARYQIFGEIARGGMGAVLKARDPDLGRELAVKVLLGAHRDNPDLVRRFVEEAQVGGQLQHPGIVPVYEIGLDAARRPYFAMKLVRGRTLAALLQDRPDPSHERRRFLAIFEQVCQTIAYAHARGVIHRDLKPANIMVGAFGEVQVVDWGLAKVLGRGGVADERRSSSTDAEPSRPTSSGSRSEAGSVLGTPSYMPPEQARGEVEGLDERADVFALGAILCEILTGSPPYVGTQAEALLLARQGATAEAFARLDAGDSDAELIDLTKRCLASRREGRPREAGAVARAVSAHLASADERARAAERDAAAARARAASERRARRLTVALATVVLLATLAAGLGLALLAHERRGRLEAAVGLERERRARAEEALAAEQGRREQDAKLAEIALAADFKGNLIINQARGAPAGEAARWAEILAGAAASADRIAAAANDDRVRRKAIDLLGSLRQTESLMRERARLADPHGPGAAPRHGRDLGHVGRPGESGSTRPIGSRLEPQPAENLVMPRTSGCPRCVVVLALTLGAPLSGAASSPDPVGACTERLKAIHGALVAYERKHQQWPDHLSDLVPEFLPDASALRDPADPGRGDLGSNVAKADPKFRVSYSYERCADVSNGLPGPLGPFPKPDIPGTGWGSWRLVNGHQETFFGDQVPLVRCYFHRPPEDERLAGRDLVLNLTPSGRVYRSDFDWEHHPDSAAHVLRTLDRDLAQGAGHVSRRWRLFRVNEYLRDCEALDPERLGPVMRSVADGLFAIRDQLPDDQRSACLISAKLRWRAGDFDGASAALDACPSYPGAPWSPIVEGELRARVYHAQKRWDREIAVYESLLRERPGVRPYMEGLAAAHEASGDRAEAERLRREADPGAQLIGQPAPDFRVPLLSGGSTTLAEARRGKKALLLNFWFRGCEPCRLEFPHLQKAYDELAGAGLEILAVDHGDSRAAIGEFVSGKYHFPIGVGRGDDDSANPIFEAYRVSVFPTSYLIDSEGRVVWRGVGFGPDLKDELSEALAKLGVQ